MKEIRGWDYLDLIQSLLCDIWSLAKSRLDTTCPPITESAKYTRSHSGAYSWVLWKYNSNTEFSFICSGQYAQGEEGRQDKIQAIFNYQFFQETLYQTSSRTDCTTQCLGNNEDTIIVDDDGQNKENEDKTSGKGRQGGGKDKGKGKQKDSEGKEITPSFSFTKDSSYMDVDEPSPEVHLTPR